MYHDKKIVCKDGQTIRGSQLGFPDTAADGVATWHPANQSASSGALTIR
jgi:hypothetical protein